MLLLRLALRSVRWRAGASTTVFVVAVIAILGATTGPIYLHAVNQTVLAERLGQADQSRRDVYISRATLLGGPVPGSPVIHYEADVRDLASQVAQRRWFAPPVFAEQAQVSYQGTTRFTGRIAAIDDVCAHVRMTAGRCVAAGSRDDTIVSARTAVTQHLALGQVIDPVPLAAADPVPLRVVGIYQPVDAHGEFWAPWNFFDAGPARDHAPPKLDSFLVSPAALATRLSTTAQTVAANVRLLPLRVRLDDLPALRTTITTAQAAATNRSVTENVSGTAVAPAVASDLLTVLAGMSKEMSLARALITVSTAQLAVLAIFVLYAVVAAAASVQGPEVALAKLRGRRPVSVVLQAVAAPVVLIAGAAPVAALLAWAAVALMARPTLGGHVGIVFPPAAYGTAAIAAAAGLVAAVVAARRVVVSPVGALLRRGADPARSSVGVAVADGAAVTLALAGLVELRAGGVLHAGRTDPLSALAPTLLAIAGAVIALRLLPIIGRALLRWTRDSPRLATFLAVRQIVRRPAGARVLLLVAVAIALAAFAVTNWSVARTNRQQRAVNEAGAWTVLQVTADPGVYDLRTAVDRADPGGHSMAVAYAENDQGTSLIAVDTHRFAGVGAWVRANAGPPLAHVLGTVGAARPASIAFTGTRVRLGVNVTRHPAAAVHLAADVVGADHRLALLDFGVVRPGRGTYDQALPPVCATGCRFTGLALSANGRASAQPTPGRPEIVASVSASAYSGGAWRSVPGFDDPLRWRSDAAAVAVIRRSGESLSVRLRQGAQDGPWATLLSTDVPAALPAVLASGTVELYSGDTHDASSIGLDGDALPIDGTIGSVTLPHLDRYGAMVDLGGALAEMNGPFAASTHLQVWLAPSAPHDMSERLARLGVHVTGTVRAAEGRAALDRTGPAFADSLFLVAAGSAIVLAMGATVLGAVTSARRRGYEQAALEVLGVAPRTLRRATTVEYTILLGLGLVIGIAAGVGGSVLALPSTPVFVDDTVGPPLLTALPWSLLAALVAGLIVVSALTCLLVARVVSRQSVAGRLREGQV